MSIILLCQRVFHVLALLLLRPSPPPMRCLCLYFPRDPHTVICRGGRGEWVGGGGGVGCAGWGGLGEKCRITKMYFVYLYLYLIFSERGYFFFQCCAFPYTFFSPPPLPPASSLPPQYLSVLCLLGGILSV